MNAQTYKGECELIEPIALPLRLVSQTTHIFRSVHFCGFVGPLSYCGHALCDVCQLLFVWCMRFSSIVLCQSGVSFILNTLGMVTELWWF